MMQPFTPNEPVPRRAWWAIAGMWAVVAAGCWAARPAVLPSLGDVLGAVPGLWWDLGFGRELLRSLGASAEALAWSTAIALPLAYVSRVPAFRPVAQGVAALRFLSPALFFLPLTLTLSSGHGVKVAMLALGEAFFLVTTMIGVVQAIPDGRFDDARTLRMSEWRATWYVVVRGTLPEALAAVRDNAAMGWAMLPMVENVVRTEGGVGVLLATQEHHMELATVYAAAGVILLLGFCVQDAALGALRRAACPWAPA
jgi:NitT/TauT family transport system permease protein